MVYTVRVSCANFMQIGLKMEARDCPTLNMNAMENYLLSHSLRLHDSYGAKANPLVHFACLFGNQTVLKNLRINKKR